MAEDFEDHCWKDIVPADVLDIYSHYIRPVGVQAAPALLAIDLYELAYEGGAKPPAELHRTYPSSCGANAWAAIEPTKRLFAAARRAGLPVFYSTQDTRADSQPHRVTATRRQGVKTLPELYAIRPDFRPLPGNVVITKQRASAFYGTPLAAHLTQLGIRTAIICGESTSGCVRATAVDAYSHGFHVVLVEECCFDRSQLSHKVNLFDLHHKYADVLHVDQVAAHLDGLAVQKGRLNAMESQAEQVQAPVTPDSWGDGARRALQPVLRFKGVLSIVGGLLVWELFSRVVINNALFLAAPSQIIAAVINLAETGELERHMGISGLEFIVGYVIASVLGIALGVGMAMSPTIKQTTQPWVSGLYATPTIALAPLFILWLGIGIWSKVIVVVTLVLFPVTINTEAGLRQTSERLAEMLRSFGATRSQIFWKLALPSATPFVLAGLKLGIGRGLIGVVVAELFGSRAGLGRLISQSADSFNMPELFAGVVILAVAGIVMTAGFGWLEGRLVPWTKD